MNVPYFGQHVTTDEHGAGIVQHVYYGVQSLDGKFEGYLCTILLRVPYLDKREKRIERIEHIVRPPVSKRYG